MGRLEDDKRDRNRIITETNTNFFVEAGAGSGKTTMLVNRMVAMVEADIDISKIAAITFTKAAAGEFYERFQKILIDRSNPDSQDEGKAGQLPKPTEETRQRCAEALKNIDLCFMGTIDSFCNVVLSEHPSEAGILSDSTIVTDAEAKVIYTQMYVRICNGEFGPELQKMANTFRAVNSYDQEVFLLGIDELMGKRNAHFNLGTAKAVDIDKDYAADRVSIIKAVKCLKEHSGEINYTGNKDSRDAWPEINDVYNAVNSRWSTNVTNVLNNLKVLLKVRVVPGAMNLYGPEISGIFAKGGATGSWLDCTASCVPTIIEELDNIKYNASVPFLLKCVEVIHKEMHDSGYLTFFDYLFYLREMLRKDAEAEGNLIRYIQERHSFFLIDEFQDTDPMQAEIFFYLASENPVAKWYECKPRPGSLFIVGDPKQSIYRFRSADVSSYLRVKGLFAENEKLTLSQNFRSKDTLINHFNTAFPELLQDDPVNHNQSAFVDIPVPDHIPDEFQGVFKYSLGNKDEDPEKLAEIIKQLVNNPNYLIRGKDDPVDKTTGKAPLRPIRYSDIMVITYGKRVLPNIMKEFVDENIPMKVEGRVLFGSNEAFLEMCNIYAAVVDSGNEASLYGALTGKVIAITKDELMVFKSCMGKISLVSDFDKTKCTDESALRVADALCRLKDLRERSRSMSPAALLAAILDEYQIYNYANTDNMEVVYYALELVRNAENSGIVKTLKDGQIFFNEIMSDDSDVERCLSLNDKEDRVRMANLHKIKGLEAPVVILARAGIKAPTPSIRIQHDDDSIEGYLFELTKEIEPDKWYTYLSTDIFNDVQKEAEKAALAAEDDRKLYVAATRARNALIVCGYGTRNRWGKLSLENMLEYENVITEDPDSDNTDPIEVNADELYKKAEEEQVLKKGKRISEEKSYSGQTPSKLELISKTKEAGSEGSSEVIIGTTTDEAAELRAFADIMGTMVHKFMEVLVSSKGRIECNNVIKEIISEHRTQAMIPYEDKVRASLEKIAATITSGGYPQPNGLPQDILKTLLDAEDVRCEVPFCYREDTPKGTVIWNGIIDVMYCEGGKWHIVDYKTNADGEDLDTKYQNQLSAYVKAFKETTGNDADAGIYHIEL